MTCGKSVGTFYRRIAARIPVGGAEAGAGVAGRSPVMFRAQQPESVKSWSLGHEQPRTNYTKYYMINVLNV